MSQAVQQAVIRRITDHVQRHELSRVSVILHGGEPLLAGVDYLVSLSTALRKALAADCSVSIGMQTNGVALRRATVAQLAAARIRVGVSVDGLPGNHDRHRRFRNGSGSHASVQRALALLASPPFRDAYAGLLCTVDVTAPPVETYEALLAFEPPSIDFLLPHANWERPPARGGDTATPYADWLVTLFDRWYDAPRQETRIRLFEGVMSGILGGRSRSEQVGLSPVAVAVVESDGDIELVDSLKTAYPGACGTGLNVESDAFDDALEHPGIVARQIGEAALGDECRPCGIRRVCGGGHYAHRFRAGAGFRNPTVYCSDMQGLIGHVRRRLAADVRRLRNEGRRPSRTAV